jgi:FkbM family methyltransferase
MEALLRKARLAITPRSWMLKHVLSNGAVVYGKNGAGQGLRGVFLKGDSLEPELEHLESFLPKDGVFIDIGANTGVFSLKAAKHFDGVGTVIAIEPGVEMLAMLSYSVKANGFSNVRIRNLCIGERTGEHKLWLNYNKPNAFSLEKRAENADSVSVLAVTLDDLCTWEGLTRLDYVKIDVVGAEQAVLAGATSTLEQFRPLLQVAVHTGHVPSSLPGYDTYRRMDGPQENVLCVPEGDERTPRIRRLGWQKL